ncbi:MAG: twin-arginine translocase TatA/TatE family subunit [Coriobacteriaceae bacterium]|nr:twin-arginine translocase TatA/TatE family subunit [Coriobacteriaceae bacterium]
MVIILIFGFLLFGPDKLPGMGRTIGRMLRQFRDAQEGFTQVVQAEVVDPLSDALNDPAEAKAKRDAMAAAAAEDADLDEDMAAIAHKETFAERRERLKAERAAAEAAAKEAAEAQKSSSEDTTSVEDADLDADSDAPAAPVAAPVKPDTSAAALYALTPRKEGGDAQE